MFHLPENIHARSSLFFTGGIWHVWQKPLGVSCIWVLAVGGGSGGGAGRSDISSTDRGGGGAGMSGGVSVCMYPAAVLPNTVYIFPGVGGTGGVPSGGVGNGGDGAGGANWTFVSAVAGSTAAVDLLLFSDISGGASGGGGGTGAGGGGSPVGAIASTPTSAILSASGLWVASGGDTDQASGGFGSGGAGIDHNPFKLSMICNGSGGGGAGNGGGGNGGNILQRSSLYPQLNGGVGDAVDNTIHGRPGVFRMNPLISMGGTGGGGSKTGTGGFGGGGGPGAGGGGGGAGVTGGTGGRGGDGFVVIMSW